MKKESPRQDYLSIYEYIYLPTSLFFLLSSEEERVAQVELNIFLSLSNYLFMSLYHIPICQSINYFLAIYLSIFISIYIYIQVRKLLASGSAYFSWSSSGSPVDLTLSAQKSTRYKQPDQRFFWSVYLYNYLSIYPFIYLFLTYYLSIYLLIFLSISKYIYIFIYLFKYLSTFLSISFYL